MTDRELMQQALDYYDEFKHLEGFTYAFGVPMEEIRARLAQPEPDELALIEQAMIEAWKPVSQLVEPEPVAWVGFNERGECREVFTRDMKKFFPDYLTQDMTPLYTAPPQREWVGLTDEEIKDILDCGRGGIVDIKKAEQKLKEKNNG